MEVTFTNGTSQQQQWVNDAIAGVSYPLDAIGLGITVDFTDTLPVSPDLGHEHTYMVTVGGGGTFTIYVAKWADDPLNRNNSGLPNPAADIYDFFKQSFVHELGHCVHLTMIVNDAQRVAAAGDFSTEETTGGSGVRVGALADWSAATWDHNMMEAIAEVFKCTYYTGRLIFGNRTIWDIDASGFDELMALLIPPSTLPTSGRASIKVVSVALDPPGLASGSTLDQYFVMTIGAGEGSLCLVLSSERVMPYGAFVDTNIPGDIAITGYASGILGVSGNGNPQFGVGVGVGGFGAYLGSVFLTGLPIDPDTGDPPFSTAGEDVATHVVALDGVATPVFPFWLALNLTETDVSAEIWQTDPALGGSPLIAKTVPQAFLPPTQAGAEWSAAGDAFATSEDPGPPPFTVVIPAGYEGTVRPPGAPSPVAIGNGVFDDLRWSNVFSDNFNTDQFDNPGDVGSKYSIAQGYLAVAGGELVSSPLAFVLADNFPPVLPLPPYPFTPPFIAAGPPEGGSVRLG